MGPHLSEGEQRRIEALYRYGVVGTPPEQVYDDLTMLAAKMLSAPIAALSFITPDQQWFKSIYGVHIEAPSRADSFCTHTIDNQLDPTSIRDTWQDSRFRDAKLVRDRPFVRAYAGAPLITPDFHAIGTLCVMDVEPRSFGVDQLEMLRTLARQAVSQLELRRQTMLLSAANDKLQMLATCDSLTGLKNIRAFQDALDDELFYAERNHSPVSLMILDVDSFKDYNDKYGHPAGDEVLQAISILLLESSREYDCVARCGGEEFAIVLRGAELDEACVVAERLRSQIEAANWPHRKITASIGVAGFGPRTHSRDALVAEADRLLYEAKRTGKNRVVAEDRIVYSGGPRRDSTAQLRGSRPPA
jgi:diguanylate cyclase (GGDEF)-like protein